MQALRKTGSGSSLDENNLERLFWRENHAVCTLLFNCQAIKTAASNATAWVSFKLGVSRARLSPSIASLQLARAAEPADLLLGTFKPASQG